MRNLFETPVSADQFESRAIVKGFGVAACRAQSLYGKGVEHFEEPIVVQVVQFDNNRIQFGVFQLNTMNLNDSKGLKNFWFSKKPMQLYEDCCYNNGRPALLSYNGNILRLLIAFYNS